MRINGSLSVDSVTSGSTATEIMVYNTGTTFLERRSTLPQSSITLGTRLAAWDALNANGILVQTSTSTWVTRTITGPAAGITVTNGNGTGGNPTLTLANDLAALEGLASTGIAVRSATDTWVQRTITGTAGQITVTNGNGVSGNPTLALDPAITGSLGLWQAGSSGTGSIRTTSGFNDATGSYHFVVGGASGGNNTITNGGYSAIVGGQTNTINTTNTNQGIFVGSNNSITALGVNNTIVGGTFNSITAGNFGSIIGGNNNSITGTLGAVYGSVYTTVAGSNVAIGASGNLAEPITVQGTGNFVSTNVSTGSPNNGVLGNGQYNSILGGRTALIGIASGNLTYNCAVISVQAGTIQQSSAANTSQMIHCVLVGGNNNSILANANASNIRTSAIYSSENSTITNNTGSQIIANTVFGGVNHTLTNTNYSTIVGGSGHTISNTSVGFYCAILGGANNTLTGNRSIIIGGALNNSVGNDTIIMASSNGGTTENGEVAYLGTNAQYSNATLGQAGIYGLHIETGNTTATDLRTAGSGLVGINIPSGATYVMDFTVQGTIMSATNRGATRVFQGKYVVKNVAGVLSTTIINSVSNAGDAATAAFALNVITFSGTRWRLIVTGIASTTVAWFAKVEYTKILL